jgi:hypothetical protein
MFIIAADDVQRSEGHAVVGPHQIFAVLLELRLLRLAIDRDGFLAQAASLREEHCAHLGEAFHGIDLTRLEKVAIGPVVVPRRQDEGMHRCLECGQNPLKILVSAGHGDLVWALFIGAWVGLEVANVDDKGEVLLVQDSYQAVELLLRDLGIRSVADNTELELLVLGVGNAAACNANNGDSHSNRKNRAVPLGSPFLDHCSDLPSWIV